jgi:hypothetical protein
MVKKINHMKRIFITAVLAVFMVLNVAAKSYDVIIAGGGTGGFAAAVQAARMGCNVLLVEETDWLGGQMSAAGVATMDEGTVGIRNHGIYQEFYHKADEYYKSIGETVGTCYWNSESCAVEPSVGKVLIYDMIKEVNKLGKGHVDVMLYTKVVEVFKQGDKINAVKIEKGLSGAKKTEKIACKILVDATEYGDVIPLTGARYRIAKHVSGSIEHASKVQDFTWTAIVKEYSAGVPEELKVKTPPKGYEAYKRHLSYIKRHTADDYNVYANPTSWNTVAYYRGLPNSETKGIDEYTTKTELNIAQNDVPVSVGDIEVPELRWKKEMELRKKTLSLIYYMQNELGLNWSVDVSQKYDSPYNVWLTNKMVTDFPDLKPYEAVLKHFPVMPYVRESRRIVGLHTLISSEIDRTKKPVPFRDAISINDYPEDLHGSKRPQDLDIDIDPAASSAAESHDWDSRTGAFYVPMRSFIPEKIDGFLAAEKNISQSRLVNGATRLQPSTMLNGQAVGNIAALSVKLGVQPRNVPAVLVQVEQLEAGAPLYGKPIIDLVKGTDNWKAAQLCLINGLLDMPGKRFFPEDPISKDNFEKIVKDNNLKIETPKGVITRAFAAELFRNYLVAEANSAVSKVK